MTQFDRHDICAAHLALETEWNSGGILWERPSNARRRMSTDVQLRRMGYWPGANWPTFETLSPNAQDIYCNALRAFGMAPMLRDDAPEHAGILAHMRGMRNA